MPPEWAYFYERIGRPVGLPTARRDVLLPKAVWRTYHPQITDEELLWEREDEPSDGLSFGQRSDSHIFGVGAGSAMGTARCWSGL